MYASEACSKRARRAASPDKARTEHPLQAVRDERATKKHNRDLGGLIKQAIVDQIKTTGECHADDLVGLYPVGEVDLCRRLATAQFGSMTGAELIREKERRKSTISARKGAKSGVYVFTEKGRAQLVGRSSGIGDGASPGALARAASGENAGAGSDTNREGQGVSSCAASLDRPAAEESSREEALPGARSSSGAAGSGASGVGAVNEGADTSVGLGGTDPAGARLFELDSARERPRSAITDPRAA